MFQKDASDAAAAARFRRTLKKQLMRADEGQLRCDGVSKSNE